MYRPCAKKMSVQVRLTVCPINSMHWFSKSQREASLARCDPVISNGCSRLHLLEVFCHEASELTKQVQLLGGRANRFGRAQGDLKTKEQRPRHIWFSPTCGPWSAWNTFNEMRSIQLCEHVQRERESHTCSNLH